MFCNLFSRLVLRLLILLVCSITLLTTCGRFLLLTRLLNINLWARVKLLLKVTNVTCQTVKIFEPDFVLVPRLSTYGKVFSFRRDKGHGHIRNRVRTVRMRLKSDIPLWYTLLVLIYVFGILDNVKPVVVVALLTILLHHVSPCVVLIVNSQDTGSKIVWSPNCVLSVKVLFTLFVSARMWCMLLTLPPTHRDLFMQTLPKPPLPNDLLVMLPQFRHHGVQKFPVESMPLNLLLFQTQSTQRVQLILHQNPTIRKAY